MHRIVTTCAASFVWTICGISLSASPATAPQTAPAATATSQPADLLDAKPTTDAKSGISIQIPKGWQLKASIADTGYEAHAKDQDKAGGLAPNIILACEPLSGIKPTDLPALIDSKRQQYPKLFDSFKIMEDKTVTINGKKAAILGGTTLVQKVLTIQMRQVWFVVNDKVYTITFTSLQATWDKNISTFDAVTQTIKIP